MSGQSFPQQYYLNGTLNVPLLLLAAGSWLPAYWHFDLNWKTDRSMFISLALLTAVVLSSSY